MSGVVGTLAQGDPLLREDYPLDGSRRRPKSGTKRKGKKKTKVKGGSRPSAIRQAMSKC